MSDNLLDTPIYPVWVNMPDYGDWEADKKKLDKHFVTVTVSAFVDEIILPKSYPVKDK